MKIKHMKTQLERILSKKRYRHTLGTAEEAVKLARHYGEDEKKAEIAALLHDYAKCYSDKDMLILCRDYGIELDAIMKLVPSLAHGLLGAKISESMFKIKDIEIINAIAYHTTGRADMSLLEKIIYIADCIEPNRKPYPGLQEIRDTAYKNINDAMVLALSTSINYNREAGRLIHPLSQDALEYITNNSNSNLELKICV